MAETTNPDGRFGSILAHREAVKRATEMKPSAELGREFLLESARENLFAAHPDLESFSWTQGTPGFNDDDPCYFGVHADEPDINGRPCYEEDDEDEDEDEEKSVAPSVERRQELAGFVAKFVYGFSYDELEDWLGDGVRVTVTRDGVSTDGYYDF